MNSVTSSLDTEHGREKKEGGHRNREKREKGGRREEGEAVFVHSSSN